MTIEQAATMEGLRQQRDALLLEMRVIFRTYDELSSLHGEDFYWKGAASVLADVARNAASRIER
ncbi:MAG: hypothetical protein KGH75_06240 [Rhodospirillales bacterium]|nr:hypothetical protein [Rhodospirillales bacterium]